MVKNIHNSPVTAEIRHFFKQLNAAIETRSETRTANMLDVVMATLRIRWQIDGIAEKAREETMD